MEDDPKILKVEYLSNCHILHFLKMKKTSNGKQPQNIKSGISQEPMVGAHSNFKPKLRLPNHTK